MILQYIVISTFDEKRHSPKVIILPLDDEMHRAPLMQHIAI